MNKKNSIVVRKLVLASMFSAIAYVTMLLPHMKVGGFLTLDIKDAIMAVGALYLGPAYAIVMSFIVALVEMLTVSDTSYYGLIMNFVGSAAFCATLAVIYKYKRSLSGAVIGLVCSGVFMTAVMLLLNLFITPLYFKMPTTAVAEMIPTTLLPFNLAKATLNSGLTLALYKPVSVALKRSGAIDGMKVLARFKLGKLSLIITVCALLIVSASIAFFVLVLGGKF